MKKTYGEDDYEKKRCKIRSSLKSKSEQFQTVHVEKKLSSFKENYGRERVLTQAEQRPGYFVTPLLEGKHQYGKMKKDDNMKQVRDELRARNVPFELNDNWTHLISLLKKDEGDDKYFFPKTDYSAFIVSDLQHPEDDGSV